jgi:internalin A
LIRPGDQWADELDENLERADIILLLVSADFIASDYCTAREMKRALERDEAGEATVIPILLRDLNWKTAPFAHLQALPTDLRAVRLWPDQDSAWRNVSEGIEQAIEERRKRGGRSGRG